MDPIKVLLFSDYAWPFCYIGKGIVEKLQREYPLEVTWISYELHPETPPEGRQLKDVFPDSDFIQMLSNLNSAGESYGIKFKNMAIIANTRLALEASEFARAHGKFAEFHTAVFEAYFVSGENIGHLDTLSACARTAGLDEDLLKQALAEHQYSAIIDHNRELGDQYDVTGLPTFIFGSNQKIVGAQRYETFVRMMKALGADDRQQKNIR